MPRLEPELCGGQNVAAFLDMLAVSEGTDDGKQRTKDDGYDVVVGGSLFSGYADHPRKLVRLPNLGISSSAAGRYQFIRRTWDGLRKKLSLPDFGPVSQDLAAIELLRESGALTLIKRGRFAEAVSKCRKIWASLPGAGYGQHEQKITKLQDAYKRAGGKMGVGP